MKNNFNDKLDRVQKFISISGIVSRKEAEKLIEEKRVKVNGEIITLGAKCLSNDEIKIDDIKIEFDLKKKKYIIMNKEVGYTSSKSEKYNHKTIFDLLNPSDNDKDLFSVGRLDREIGGLIILTNDKGLSQNILHPLKKITKEYQLTLNKKLLHSDKLKIEDGLLLDDYKLKPCQINILGPSYTIKVIEDRKKLIIKIFERVGYNVTNLRRVKIGNLNLNTLKLKDNEYKIVSKKFLEENIFN